MAKKRKPRAAAAQDEAEPALPKVPEIGTQLAALLTQAGLSKVKPSVRSEGKRSSGRPRSEPAPKTMLPPGPAKPSFVREAAHPHDAPLSSRELAELHRAYAGVAPIRKAGRGRVQAAGAQKAAQSARVDPADDEARTRLAALVGAGVRFEVRRDAGFVQGLQRGAAEKLLRPLGGSAFAPDATLDLHGLRREAALRAVHDFVRAQHRAGARRLLIIAGKGQHSEGGVSVLGEALVEALTQGGAAPLVRAFASAHNQHGGTGAVAVLLG